MIKNINLQRIIYILRHDYLSSKVIIPVLLFVMVASWIVGSVGVMQRNYELQHVLLRKEREKVRAVLEVEAMRYENSYYQTEEYQELAVREQSGKGLPGEKVLILKPNSPAILEQARIAQLESRQKTSFGAKERSNFEQWVDFLSGKNAQLLR